MTRAMKCYWAAGCIVSCAVWLAVSGDAAPAKPVLRATFFALDRGDSTLIQAPGGITALIGAGAPGEAPRLLQLLRERGVRHIDEFVAPSWADEQIGGAVEVVHKLRPRHVTLDDCYVSTPVGRALKGELDNLMQTRKLEYQGATPNDTQAIFYSPPCQIHIVGPSGPMLVKFAGDLNNALVIEMAFGNTSILSLGRSTRKHQKDIWEQTANRPWGHVLAIGHAGAENAWTPAWLKPLRTQYAIIPVPRKGTARPAPTTLTALEKAGVRVFRTDRQGTITVTTDSKSINVKGGT